MRKKIEHFGWVVAIFLCMHCAAYAQATSQHAATKSKHSNAGSFAFEPLDNWKTTVLEGNRSALMNFYTTNPAAKAKTPQGETLDPGEEPTFWSSLKQAGLDRLNVQVLEAKTLQPGVMALTLRMEAGLKSGGKKKPSSSARRKSGCNSSASGKL